MAASPPASPPPALPRPLSAMVKPSRSTSRMSVSSKPGGSRASDDEAKTSVKVAVRIRPPLRPSDPGFDLIPQRFQRSMIQVTSPTSLAVDSPQGRKLFVFDKVFGEDVHQSGIWDYIAESVHSFVQGYNVSVMAYGQSGAGKSFTMGTSGPLEQSDPQLKGVIPRAAAVLFDLLNPSTRSGSGIKTPNRYSMGSVYTLQNVNKAPENRNWQMKATYVEIYNEQLRDLLIPEYVPQNERGPVSIREDAKGRIILTGLQQVPINSIEDLMNALNSGSSIRQTDATAINAKSSRSHAVFSLNLVQRKNKGQETPLKEKRMSVPLEALTGSTDNWITVDSKLHFVDLAGSERLKNTGASGERAKEGISINAGLASLGKVIAQLSSRQAGSHVSYRDSKLTRLLQDSLGGTAITYMIACVTPAEFHLSETLNTVQYAQRARAIQIKPKIQQISDDSDKQALIDRLRAEVSFLRDQIRNSERSDRLGSIPQEARERQNEREIELQNHLLDVQENYTALSQRHARLIAEITKARDSDSKEVHNVNGAAGDSAMERLKRSNTFAEAVEQVVLEYEKTIQSLESSLSNTRSSLASTESSLLERETKCTYVETINQQLQARLQKMMDRESGTEQYLHDLEAKLDGRETGDEQSSTVHTELRKEIGRLRDNEATNEEYISTLEERLAEADQDMDLMSREVSRLEHVVERQRSLGKLDNLLYELDHMHSNDKSVVEDKAQLTNGHVNGTSAPGRKHGLSSAVLKLAMETPIPESDEEGWEHPPTSVEPEHQAVAADNLDGYAPSPAQSKHVAEKLESVNQELFDLKVEHEATLNDYDLLSAKYEEALRTLAAMQDAADSHASDTALGNTASPTAFLAHARVNEIRDAGLPSSSQSLSSELSSAGDTPASQEPLTTLAEQPASDSSDMAQELPQDAVLAQQMEDLKNMHTQREQSMVALQRKYAQLQEQHLETLDTVEELKTEIAKSKMGVSTSPTSQFIRRKSSQNVLTMDRANRSLASLGNIAAENLQGKPDAMESFELSLGAVMHELHQRSERVQLLETELANNRKEMETKMAIISGLTRERSSLKSSPLDMSVVSSMRDQILQSETRMKKMHETHANREQELVYEIESLKMALVSKLEPEHAAAEPSIDGSHIDEDGSHLDDQEGQEEKVSQLKGELTQWESKHNSALTSMKASEKKLMATIAELEATLTQAEGMRKSKTVELDGLAGTMAAATAAFELERSHYATTVTSLNREIESHKSTIEGHAAKIDELEQAHANAQREVESGNRFRENTKVMLDRHRDQISSLEAQLQEHQSEVEAHKEALNGLQDSHVRELDDTLRSTQADADAYIADVSSQHRKAMEGLQQKHDNLRQQLDHQQSSLEEHKRLFDERGALIEQLQQEKESNRALTSNNIGGLQDVQTRLQQAESAKQAAEASAAQMKARIDQLGSEKATLSQELVELRGKEERARRLVEELEGQLTSTFEDSRNVTSRLSLMQSTREQELVEARAATTKAQEEIAVLANRLEQVGALPHTGMTSYGGTTDRTNSMTSNLHKSASVASLPSPPPAIPLPPLPGTTISSGSPDHSLPRGFSPDPMHPKRDSTSAAAAQRAEEQEARIRTIEKHLFAEKQLTATLEEALVDLETQGNKVKAEVESWKKKAWAYEDELGSLRKERNANRNSLAAVEEERTARREAEAARAHLEDRMAQLNRKNKKKSTLNCF